ncbi:hypothetical protein MTO96_014970 [Rhipicephalus appendiculatus]
MLKSLVSPHYPAVEPRHQLVPSPSHSAGVASPVSMADAWGMNELGVWFDESENGVAGPPGPMPDQARATVGSFVSHVVHDEQRWWRWQCHAGLSRAPRGTRECD